MPDPITHATAASIKYSGYGIFGGIVAMLFDVSPEVVIACIVGSIFAVMVLHVLSFKIAAFSVMAGTFGSAYATPFIQNSISISDKGIGFFTAFALIYFWGLLIESMRDIVLSFRDAVISKIKGWGDK